MLLMGQDQDFDRAEKLKEEANSYFKDGAYNDAIQCYSEAIILRESAIYYSNRSFAYFRMECFGYALDDAKKAIELDSSYVKVIRLAPNDKAARSKQEACKKLVLRQKFAEAIVLEDKPPVLESFDPSSVSVESDYDGPHLETEDDGQFVVTKTFMISLLKHFKSQKKLHRKYALIILQKAYYYFKQLPSMIRVDIPQNTKFTVCGDIHGQFYDLLNILDLNGLPGEDNPYLFNGDFVDRGSFSVECIFTLLGFKLLYPNHFFMSRGNHESENMNRMYGFDGEVRAKFDDKMVEMFTEMFNFLPLAHLLDSRILVMHGGLFSKDDVKLDEIEAIDRNRQPNEGSVMCELLWSDPMEAPGRCESKRGIGCQFGPDVSRAFCEGNHLECIIRSHEVKPQGYEVAHDGRCITVFSAPNYCDTMQNLGAYITLTNLGGDQNLSIEYTTFKAAPHPNVKPMAYVSPFMSMLV